MSKLTHYNLLLVACNRQPNAGTLATIRLLLEVGANPNTVDDRGNTPLHHVVFRMLKASESDSLMVTVLLEYGALPNQRNYSKDRVLDLWTRQKTMQGRTHPFIPIHMDVHRCHTIDVVLCPIRTAEQEPATSQTSP